MKRLVVLSIMVIVLGCASWAGAYTYSVSGNHGVFTNNSGDDSSAVVDLTLYYGNANGNGTSYYAYSTDGSIWSAIGNSGDGQSWAYTGVIADGCSFWLKFVEGSDSVASLSGSASVTSGGYYFEFNQGNYSQDPISGCVAIVEGSPAVPIPAAVWLLGSGLGTLFVARRKRKV